MLNKNNRQIGKRKSISRDRKLPALRPGKRLTSWGTTYYERRKNRSDKPLTNL